MSRAQFFYVQEKTTAVEAQFFFRMNDGSDSDSHPDDDSNYDGSSDEENNQNVANIDPESIAVAHRLIKNHSL